VGDTLGVLQGAVKFKAKNSIINPIVMELALLFAPVGAELSAVHIWSEDNVLADALSRLDEGAVLPPLLTKVPRGLPRRDGFRVLGKPSSTSSGTST
jgi:hypothetical protein